MSITLKTPIDPLTIANTFKDWMDSYNYLLTKLSIDSNGLIGPAAVPPINDATTSVKGKIAIIDSNGVVLGNDDTKAVTANKLKVAINNRIIDSNGAVAGTDDFKLMTAAKTKVAITTAVPNATTAVVGKSRLASSSETQGLSLTTVAITPGGLNSLNASTTQKGIAKVADSNGVVLGNDDTTIVTPTKLKLAINQRIADSNGAASGTDDFKLMTPAKTKVAIQSISPTVPPASTTIAGKIQIIDSNGVVLMNDDTKAVTPSKLRTWLNNIITATAQTITALWTFRQVKYTVQNLTPGATVSWNAALGNVANLTLGSSANVMQLPTNIQDGGFYCIRVYEDIVGGRSISWASGFKWPSGQAPSPTTAANALDIYFWHSDGTNMYSTGYILDVR